MPNPVVHWEIAARDVRRAQQFYSQLFGWRVDSSNPIGYGLVDTQAKAGINGGIMQAVEGQPPMVTVYVEVDDLQVYLRKAGRLGAKTIVPPTVVPGMVTFALFADPDGNVVGLVKSEQPAGAAKRPQAGARARKAAPAKRTARRSKR